MNLTEYSKSVLETESPIDTALITRASQNDALRLLHSGLGLCTEAGEFVDALKKHIFYNRPLDRTNLKEELGDVMWYIALAADELDLDLDKLLQANILKLKSRYANGYNHNSAKNRDTKTEQDLVAKGTK
jgi:NTP pyrophosphatase (non-canonical NTP hydrolase)